MTEKLPDIFWEIHNNLPREGTGDKESTKKLAHYSKTCPKTQTY